MKKFCIVLLYSYSVIVFNNLFGQKANKDSVNNKLSEVVVTATKTQRVLSSLPMNVTIVKKEDIQKINANRLSDVINEEFGLITVSDFGGGEGIQMQGLDSQYTLILIDNQPIIGRLAGTLDLDRIAVENIKQIEIVRGASSSLYGNEALAGVVNIITNEPNEGLSAMLSSSIETNNTKDNNISLTFKEGSFSSSLFFNSYSSDGYDLNNNDELKTVNEFENKTLQLKLGYKINNNFDIKLNSRYFTQSVENIAPNNQAGKTDTREDNINLSIHHKSNKINSDLDLYFTSYYGFEYLNDESENLVSESYYDQILFKPEIKSIYSVNDNDKIILGAGLKHESLKRTYFDINPEQNSPFLYFQYDYNPNEKINLIFGGRYDRFKDYKSQFSPKFSGIYKLDENKSLKISVGYGFKSPDFRQLYFNFSNSVIGYSVIGYNVYENVLNQLIEQGEISSVIIPVEEFNESLKPESSFSVNIGYDLKLNDNINFKTNLFNNITKDLIDTRVVAGKTNGQNVFSYYNINEVLTSGFEFETIYKFDNYLKFSIGYQLLYAFDLDALNEFKNGNIYARLSVNSPSFQLKKSDYYGLYNRSKHMAMFKVSLYHPKSKIDTRLRIRYRSKYGLYDTNGNNYLDKYDDFVKSYFTANLAFNKTLNKINISAGVENLLNYTDNNNISNLSGRLYYLKINLKLNNKS